MSNFEAGPADDEPLFGHSQPCDQTNRCSLPALSRTAWNGVALGQLISLLISGTGVCSQYLSNNNVNYRVPRRFSGYCVVFSLFVATIGRYTNDTEHHKLLFARGAFGVQIGKRWPLDAQCKLAFTISVAIGLQARHRRRRNCSRLFQTRRRCVFVWWSRFRCGSTHCSA
jgi:Solute carrier family 35